MATDLALKAKDAFIDDDFELAVDLLTQATKLDPDSADLYSDRSQAHMKLGNFTEAVADASKAIELDPSVARSYLRKGMACMKLEEYHTAKAALEKGASLSGDGSKFTKLIEECDLNIAQENPEDTSCVSPASPVSSETEEIEQIDIKEETKQPKYRHGHYQSAQEVVVTIYAKGVSAEQVNVDFGEQILSVYIYVPGEEPYHFQPRLFGKIIPDKCRFAVRATTVEIRLVKAEAIQWTSLEYSNKVAVPQKAYASTVDTQKPTYPSSKPKRTDWDKLEAEVKKEEKDEKLDGDAALNKFFRDIYKDADEDMRRAMNKSFVESSGTVLSTNWKDVGKKKVESTPPDGMELKKWEY